MNRDKNLITGDVFLGTASEENIALATEIAAGIFEIIHGREIGSVLDLTPDQKLELINKSVGQVQQDAKEFQRQARERNI